MWLFYNNDHHNIFPFRTSGMMCHHNCFRGTMRNTSQTEKVREGGKKRLKWWNKKMVTRRMTACEDEYKLGSKCGLKEMAKAAHFHACWLFWPPGPCLSPSPFCVLCLFASWLWTEMGLSTRLSFEVLWLSAKRSAVPAAICEGAASSRPSLHFPSMAERGRSQERWWAGRAT